MKCNLLIHKNIIRAYYMAGSLLVYAHPKHIRKQTKKQVLLRSNCYINGRKENKVINSVNVK